MWSFISKVEAQTKALERTQKDDTERASKRDRRNELGELKLSTAVTAVDLT